ncbi:hypothetical protein H0H92_013700 [Tricholoma furcatifolium]|nr:hypothetical protein H0H92_013700 [Tricholoma furcatifolium]
MYSRTGKEQHTGGFSTYPELAGQWIRQEKTRFEMLRDQLVSSFWEPFESEEEWELAMWLLKNVGQKSTEEFIRLPIIDKLPTGPEWHCKIVTVKGDLIGEDGELMTENLELWFRDPVEVVRELIGNPAFKEMMAYVPEQVFQDEACRERVFDEMWMANWWWNLQDFEETLQTLREHKRGQEPPQFERNGLRVVYKPFWHNFPHCNIFQCFTPDLLHQLHKGVFKDHFVKWCTKIMGAKEVDERFKAMADHPGLRHFKKGISLVTQ